MSRRLPAEERRAAILASALTVFAEKGYHATSVTDLVEAAGVARGTFYLYFESKHALFTELLDEVLGLLRGAVQGVDTRPGAAPLAEQLTQTVTRVLQVARAHRPIATLVFREAVGLDANVDARIAAFEERLQAYLVESLERGVAMGLLRGHATEPVATAIYGAIRQVIVRWVVQEAGGDEALEEVAAAVVGLHLGGVGG